MNSVEQEIEYEEKMDRITELIEELVLDAMLAALSKIDFRNQIFLQRAQNRLSGNNRF